MKFPSDGTRMAGVESRSCVRPVPGWSALKDGWALAGEGGGR